jgi:predicted kinase
MHPARLFMVGGLPGAGKTARSGQIAKRFGAVPISSDEWMERLGIDIWDQAARGRIESAQADLTIDLLRAGAGVVVEWGLWTRAERDQLRSRAVAAGAFVHLEFLDAPVDTLWDRVRARGREQRIGSRAITRADLEAWSRVVERPASDELASYDRAPPLRTGGRLPDLAFPY